MTYCNRLIPQSPSVGHKQPVLPINIDNQSVTTTAQYNLQQFCYYLLYPIKVSCESFTIVNSQGSSMGTESGVLMSQRV